MGQEVVCTVLLPIGPVANVDNLEIGRLGATSDTEEIWIGWPGGARRVAILEAPPVASSSASGSLEFDGALSSGARSGSTVSGSLEFAGALGSGARSGSTASGALEFAGAVGSSSRAGSAATGSIEFAGAAQSGTLPDSAASGSIEFVGAAQGGSLAGSAATGSLQFVGAVQSAGGAGSEASGAIEFDGAATSHANYLWDGITDLCISSGEPLFNGFIGVSGSCTDGTGSWGPFGADARNIDTAGGVWTCAGVTGVIGSLSPLRVDFTHVPILSGAWSGTFFDFFVTEDMTNCAGPACCGATCDLVSDSGFGGQVFTNTGPDEWSVTYGTCSDTMTVTCSGGVYSFNYHTSVAATSVTCDPFSLTFHLDDTDCNGDTLPSDFTLNCCLRYSCDGMGGCSDFGCGTGTYATMAECLAACRNNAFDCDNTGACAYVGVGTGHYSTTDCDGVDCSNLAWDCVSGSCNWVGMGNGQYSDSNCGDNCNGWDCVSGNCTHVGSGSGHFDEATCDSTDCNDSAWICSAGACDYVGVGNGVYSTSNCDANCSGWGCSESGCTFYGDGVHSYDDNTCGSADCNANAWDCDGMGSCIYVGPGFGPYSDNTCGGSC